MVLKPDLRMTPDLQLGACPHCQVSTRTLWSPMGRPEAGSVSQRSWLVWERCGVDKPEENRRCKAVGERVSGAAGVDYEEYWTLRLSGLGCLMCSPAKNTNTKLWHHYCITVLTSHQGSKTIVDLTVKMQNHKDCNWCLGR